MSHQLIVAIGRESGSGGLDIAHALAERLQLPLFDKSILQKAAEDKGVSTETLERYDERPYSPLFCRSVRGISSAPEDCVAQMQFELLRQHANAGESFVVPEPSPMPGYDCDVIMASGTYTFGSSIELSADAPLREPFAAWMQGGVNFNSGRLGAILAAQSMLNAGFLNL